MSLAIEVDTVTEVLLADGKWYKVAKKSFDLDSYEYVHGNQTLLEGGALPGIPSTGATWVGPDKKGFACPLSSIVAVKLAKLTRRPKNVDPKTWAIRQRNELIRKSGLGAEEKDA